MLESMSGTTEGAQMTSMLRVQILKAALEGLFTSLSGPTMLKSKHDTSLGALARREGITTQARAQACDWQGEGRPALFQAG